MDRETNLSGVIQVHVIDGHDIQADRVGSRGEATQTDRGAFHDPPFFSIQIEMNVFAAVFPAFQETERDLHVGSPDLGVGNGRQYFDLGRTRSASLGGTQNTGTSCKS